MKKNSERERDMGKGKNEIRFSVKAISLRPSSHPRQCLVTLSLQHRLESGKRIVLPTLGEEVRGHLKVSWNRYKN
jgi:hypothetical protein